MPNVVRRTRDVSGSSQRYVALWLSLAKRQEIVTTNADDRQVGKRLVVARTSEIMEKLGIEPRTFSTQQVL
jgi:uncharacterized NAD-dependent epimerase/dehydratase family protein